MDSARICDVIGYPTGYYRGKYLLRNVKIEVSKMKAPLGRIQVYLGKNT